MKEWKAPEVAELNINETANGFFDIHWETPLDFVGNDQDHDKKPEAPSTPDDHS